MILIKKILITDHEKLVIQERSLCRQLSHIIQILYTLANVAIKPGTTTEFMFNNLKTLYNILGNLTKYFHKKSSKQNAAFQSVKYNIFLYSINNIR